MVSFAENAHPLVVDSPEFAMSAGPLIWTRCSEVQPLKGRDFMSGKPLRRIGQ